MKFLSTTFRAGLVITLKVRMVIAVMAVFGALEGSRCVYGSPPAAPPTGMQPKAILGAVSIFTQAAATERAQDAIVVGPKTCSLRFQPEGRSADDHTAHPFARCSICDDLQFTRLAAANTTSAPTRGNNHAALAATAFIKAADLPDADRSAMLTVLRQHPDASRWTGQSGRILFGIATKVLPTSEAGQQSVAAVLNLTHSLAVQELLSAKSVIQRYGEAGLTDSTTLGQAVKETAGNLQVVGKAKTLQHASAAMDGFAVSYVIADGQDLTVRLFQQAELGMVKARYRDIMHVQARRLMKNGNWQDAILLWQHLHSRQLVSQSLYLDAARCFIALNQKEDAARVLAEALQAFEKTAPGDFFEQVGDIALGIDTPTAQELAKNAYNIASQRLLTSSAPPGGSFSQDGLKIKAYQ